jgi:hypothetical protein
MSVESSLPGHGRPQGPSSVGEIESAIARHRRQVLVVTIAVTIALIALSVGLLFYTARQLTDMNAQLAVVDQNLQQAKRELNSAVAQKVAAEADAQAAETQRNDALAKLNAAQDDVEALNEQVTSLQEQLRESTNFEQHIHPLTWDAVKELYGISDRQARLLERIFEFTDQGSHPMRFSTANDPSVGFTSPGFARYILDELGIVPASAPWDDIRGQFPPDPAQPKNGDIIIYEAGYTMFYFETPYSHETFVIGMTPAGVIALDPEFGPAKVEIISTHRAFR